MTHKMQAACEANASHNTKAALGNDSSASTASDISSDPDYPQNTPNADPFSTFSTAFSLTDREQSVFDQLVNTEKSIQEIADSLFISRRTCQRYITSIYEKVGAKSRMGLYQSYIDWQRKNLYPELKLYFRKVLLSKSQQPALLKYLNTSQAGHCQDVRLFLIFPLAHQRQTAFFAVLARIRHTRMTT